MTLSGENLCIILIESSKYGSHSLVKVIIIRFSEMTHNF